MQNNNWAKIETYTLEVYLWYFMAIEKFCGCTIVWQKVVLYAAMH